MGGGKEGGHTGRSDTQATGAGTPAPRGTEASPATQGAPCHSYVITGRRAATEEGTVLRQEGSY